MLIRILPPFLFLVILAVSAGAQPPAQTAPSAELATLNEELLQALNMNDLTTAAAVGRKIAERAGQMGLSSHPRVLAMLRSLASVYTKAHRHHDATELLTTILERWRGLGGDRREVIADTLESLGISYYYEDEYERSRDCFKEALQAREDLSGRFSKPVQATLKALIEVTELIGDGAAADEYYRRWIIVNDRLMTPVELANRPDLGSYECYLYEWAFKKGDISRALGPINEYRAIRLPIDRRPPEGVVNGAATKLVTPKTPKEFKEAKGFVVVRVEVGEAGKVVLAKSVCGDPLLVEPAEKAAMKSKFDPGLDRRVPLRGVVIYQFVR